MPSINSLHAEINDTLPSPCDSVPGFPVGPAVDTKGVVVGAEVVVVFTARKEKIHSLDWHADYSGGLLDHQNNAYHQKAPKSK